MTHPRRRFLFSILFLLVAVLFGSYQDCVNISRRLPDVYLKPGETAQAHCIHQFIPFK